MHFPKSQTIDLNLLVPLFALLEERHVTRAAERCRTSQSVMSRMLERLRIAFDDELLVRSSGSYERTQRGNRLIADLSVLLPRLEAMLRGDAFDPATSRETFTIATTDYAAAVFVPSLLKHVASAAPNVRLEISSWSERVDSDLEAGRTQIAIIGDDSLRAFESEPLFEDEFVCVVAANHPLGSARMTLDEYVSYDHVVLRQREDGQPWIDEALAALGRARRIAFRTPYQLSGLMAAAKSELICTTARRLAAQLTSAASVRLVAAPLEFPTIKYKMTWHRRLVDDSSHLWLRRQLSSVAATAFADTGVKRSP